MTYIKETVEIKLNESPKSLILHDHTLINFIHNENSFFFRFVLNKYDYDEYFFGDFYSNIDESFLIFDLEFSNIKKFSRNDWGDDSDFNSILDNDYDEKTKIFTLNVTADTIGHHGTSISFVVDEFKWKFISRWDTKKYDHLPWNEELDILIKEIGLCTL